VIVASVGDNCVDRYLGAPALALAGGNALNVAAGLSAAGLKSYYLGAVGEDANAELILDGARGAEVATDRVRRLPEPTGVTEVRLRSDGDREFVDDALHGLPREAHVTGDMGDRMGLSGNRDRAEHLPPGARQSDRGDEPVAGGEQRSVQAEGLEHQFGRGKTRSTLRRVETCAHDRYLSY